MSISAVTSNFLQYGVARNNRFEISGNAVPSDVITNQYIKNVSFPAKSFGQMTVRDVGAPIKYPYDVIYNEVIITFIDNNHLGFYSFYQHWWDSIYKQTGGGGVGFEYYEKYVRDMKIMQMDTKNSVNRTTQLFNCYLSNLSEIQFNHETSTPVEFSVTLTYEYSEVKGNSNEVTGDSGGGLLDGILNGIIDNVTGKIVKKL